MVEVLSTGTSSRDRGEKKAIYERNGVTEYWLVDRWARELTRFVLGDARYDAGRIFTEHERVESEVLRGIEFAVADALPR